MKRFLFGFALACLGMVMMVIGLALGVTLIGLPGGLVVGLVGCGLFVGGINYASGAR